MISDELRARMREVVARYPQPRSAMLPCLHLVQDALGYIPEEGLVAVADAIGAKPDEVESIVTFYSMFHRAPQGKYVIKVCTSISCYLGGCDAVLERLERTLGVARGSITADGAFTVEGVECLAACGMAPALQVNGEFAERVTPDDAERLVEYLARGGSLEGIRSEWRQIAGGAGMATETTIGARPASGDGAPADRVR